MNEAGDIVLRSWFDLSSYLRACVDHYVGVRVDQLALLKVALDMINGSIPNLRDRPSEEPLVTPKYPALAAIMYYIFATALGAQYGTDFGHWTENGSDYYIWKEFTPETHLAAEYLELYLLAGSVAKSLGEDLKDRLPVRSHDVETEWFRSVSRKSRIHEYQKAVLLKEMQVEAHSSIEELEYESMILDIPELQDPREVDNGHVPESMLKGVTFLRRPAPFVIVPFGQLSGPDEQIENDPALEQARKDLREYIKSNLYR